MNQQQRDEQLGWAIWLLTKGWKEILAGIGLVLLVWLAWRLSRT